MLLSSFSSSLSFSFPSSLSSPSEDLQLQQLQLQLLDQQQQQQQQLQLSQFPMDTTTAMFLEQVDESPSSLFMESMEMESPIMGDGQTFFSTLTDSSPFTDCSSLSTSVSSPATSSCTMSPVPSPLPSPSTTMPEKQIETWCSLPVPFQQELFSHYVLYLDQIQTILQVNDFPAPPSAPSTPTISPMSSPSPWNEKRRPYNFVDDNARAKRVRRELTYSPLSSPYSSPSCPSSPASPPSSPHFYHQEYVPNNCLPLGIKELAALLPSISEMEESVRLGTTSASATNTMIELSKNPELLALKQSDAARIMGISTSVLSKRWREVTRGKKWPHRIHHKLKRIGIC